MNGLKTPLRMQVPMLPLLILCVLTPANGQDAELVIDNSSAYAHRQRPPVTFSHELHMESFDCLACHHDYAGGENRLDTDELVEDNPAIRCAACHDRASALDLEKGYHHQCMGCHRRLRKSGAATGPELCGECHIH